MKTSLIASGVTLFSFTPGLASADNTLMVNFLDTDVRVWANDPVLIDAILAQNAITRSYTQQDIDEADLAWRAAVKGS